MNVAINNRFGILLAERRVKEKHNISLMDVARETGLPHKTLFAWQSNTVTRFDVHVINAICQYFGIQPGELFEYVPDNPDQPQPKQKACMASVFWNFVFILVIVGLFFLVGFLSNPRDTQVTAKDVWILVRNIVIAAAVIAGILGILSAW